MAVNLSIRNVPDEWVEKLRERAKRNHRSLQGELLSILEETLIAQTIERLKMLIKRSDDLNIRPVSEATQMIREDQR